ncbi:phosphoribosyl-ATP diphosphatase [Sphingomonas sp. BK069]|uniref:phosphoribosyl-ATP diphosphatase n=1 Tax=Sphingomonas sp. BK069 TaxID=2586979 RepID=UPI001608C8A1|nr:phosphoribosyl-ATP diphosphatase [Sphingomonas sp. BK069]MBB3349726.1 phosphoribosyl-ATP pyrophosphohydrolase [Sphingomonas sp. BK069]
MDQPEPLDRLFATIASRRDADPASSYTASLFARGRPHIAQKLGEEAVETVIAALCDDERAIVREAADLLYHLLVLLADAGLSMNEVRAELARRSRVSGHAEKAARGAPLPPYFPLEQEPR